MMMQPMAGQQMVPASPAYSVQSNMSGYSADAGVPLDYLMAPQQSQETSAGVLHCGLAGLELDLGLCTTLRYAARSV